MCVAVGVIVRVTVAVAVVVGVFVRVAVAVPVEVGVMVRVTLGVGVTVGVGVFVGGNESQKLLSVNVLPSNDPVYWIQS